MKKSIKLELVYLKSLTVLKYFCGKYELPLRGHDESSTSSNAGVFRGLLDFLSDYDFVSKNHLKSNLIFKGISKTIS